MVYRKESRFSGTYLYVRGDNDTDEEIKENITGLISLYDEHTEIGMEALEVRNLLKCLVDEGVKLETENKSIEGLILEPLYIYKKYTSDREKQEHDYRFLYYPYVGKSNINSFQKRIEKLMEYILWHIDYDDKEAIKISYEAYMKVHRGDYIIDAPV